MDVEACQLVSWQQAVQVVEFVTQTISIGPQIDVLGLDPTPLPLLVMERLTRLCEFAAKRRELGALVAQLFAEFLVLVEREGEFVAIVERLNERRRFGMTSPSCAPGTLPVGVRAPLSWPTADSGHCHRTGIITLRDGTCSTLVHGCKEVAREWFGLVRGVERGSSTKVSV